MASAANPGVPPGSLFSFLRAKPSIAAVTLTDFDTAFANRFYDSRFDNGSDVHVGSIAAAAAVAARALHALAAGPDATPLLVIFSIWVFLAACSVECCKAARQCRGCTLQLLMLNAAF